MPDIPISSEEWLQQAAAAAASEQDHLQAKVVTFSVSVSCRQMSTAGNKHVLSTLLPAPTSCCLCKVEKCFRQPAKEREIKDRQKESQLDKQRDSTTGKQSTNCQTKLPS